RAKVRGFRSREGGSSMRKWITLVVAVSMLGFTACGGGTSGSKKSEEVKGEGNASLAFVLPKAAEMKVNDKTDLKITVERKHFDDAVTIKFEDLPTGVSVDGGESQKIDKGSHDKTFTLKASKDAKEVKDHAVKVTGTFNDGKENRSTSDTFKLA